MTCNILQQLVLLNLKRFCFRKLPKSVECQQKSISRTCSRLKKKTFPSDKQGVVAGGKARHSAQGSAEPKAETPTNTGEEIGKLADVSKSTKVFYCYRGYLTPYILDQIYKKIIMLQQTPF